MFFLNSAIWYKSIWSHNHEIANLLSKKWKVFWLDPIKVKWYPHFEQINNDINLKNVEILNEKLFLKSLSPFYLIKSEIESLKYFWKLRKKVNYFLMYNISWNFLSFILAKILWKKVIFFYVDDYIALSKNKVLKLLLKFLLPIWFKFSDKIICTAKILEQEVKKYNKNTFYYPNGVNLDKLSQQNSKKIEKLRSIWFVWALWNWVDWEIIIELVKKLKNINFEIVWDWEIFSYLKIEKERNNLDNLILYWFKSHKEALKIIWETDITIIPFKINKITDAVSPVKLFEYWSLWKTSIVSNTLELQQFNEELFIYKNEENLFEIIEKISRNTGNIYKKSELSVNKLENFNWSGNLGVNILEVII
jgi:hypothetical protein